MTDTCLQCGDDISEAATLGLAVYEPGASLAELGRGPYCGIDCRDQYIAFHDASEGSLAHRKKGFPPRRLKFIIGRDPHRDLKIMHGLTDVTELFDMKRLSLVIDADDPASMQNTVVRLEVLAEVELPEAVVDVTILPDRSQWCPEWANQEAGGHKTVDPYDVDCEYVRNSAGEVRWVDAFFDGTTTRYRWRNPTDPDGTFRGWPDGHVWGEWAGESLEIVQPQE